MLLAFSDSIERKQTLLSVRLPRKKEHPHIRGVRTKLVKKNFAREESGEGKEKTATRKRKRGG